MNIYLKLRNNIFYPLSFLSLFLLITAKEAYAETDIQPQQLIVNTLSASEISLSWQAPQDSATVKEYLIFRNGEQVATTQETTFVDTELNANSSYSYYIVATDEQSAPGEPSNSDTATTLVSNDNDGLNNGSVITLVNLNLRNVCGVRTIADVPAENLDSCLDQVIEAFTLKESVEDIRAFVARLRRQEDPALVDLGMRLFHSKSLSQNNDTACSSCHHPAIGCGSDGLSLPIGVDADNPDLLGPGRADGNTVPLVGRHSPQICNSALWVHSMFWDQRIVLEDFRTDPVGQVSTKEIRTPERDVTRSMAAEVDSADPLRLLIAQAHFPVTAAEEMGDTTGFDSPQSYRNHIATKLTTDWKDEFNQVYGSEDVTFMRTARALAAYEASFLFIDNPFFDYVGGDRDSLTEDEKRGALFFYTGAGCSNCHDGALFTPDRTRPPLYPQIGANAVADGNNQEQFRMPSLLNVGLTAPYGDKGVFPTLERVIEHYSNTHQSLLDYYENNETCDLPQFQHLSDEECESVVGGGKEYILARMETDGTIDAPTPNFTEQEVAYLAAFLHSLTDKSAMAGSNEINALIPPRDGGPDGNQLDAEDKDGNPL
ncbi:cytochrome c peroxidase [Thalassomonas sp. RHCl1]|uniref:cytochrome-c peroxidase n=1 Tax=Thalassomonas sp. RHCl1 TaxID=2995320 RepID=UPI00248AFFEB|nr:cytochrome c peroxidase [Thalassomonas sp. RHCl1]